LSLQLDIPQTWASLPAWELRLPPHRQADSRGRHNHPCPPWYSPPLSARSRPDTLEATAIQVTLAGKPVIVPAAHLSPSRPLIGADLATCFGGELSALMAGNLNTKHVDWNSRLSTRRGKSLRGYADEKLRSDLWTGLPNHQPI